MSEWLCMQQSCCSWQTLRKTLDDMGLSSVQIVAADGNFKDISANVQSDPDLKAAVSILG